MYCIECINVNPWSTVENEISNFWIDSGVGVANPGAEANWESDTEGRDYNLQNKILYRKPEDNDRKEQ